MVISILYTGFSFVALLHLDFEIMHMTLQTSLDQCQHQVEQKIQKILHYARLW